MNKKVDIASIVFFRIAFGAIMIWEVFRYASYGWIAKYYIRPNFLFKYYGFEWVHPWPGNGMYYHFLVIGILSFCVMVGFLYRYAATLLFLAFTYMFLLDQTRYLNHFYLVSLVSFIMILVPAHRYFSVDALLRPKLNQPTAPSWALWILRIHVAIPYFFGGIAKLNWDWLRGEPMRMWLANRTNFPYIGQYFTQEWVVYFFSYGGLLFDLFIVPALLYRPTRMIAFYFALFFHLMNVKLFNIGIFPWFMICATTLFFDPDWPRQVANLPKIDTEGEDRFNPVLKGCLTVYLAIQFLMPFRHHLYPGVVHWTEEGHKWSWHMKLRDKRGIAKFYVVNPKERTSAAVFLHDFLTPRQAKKMATRPEMVLQMARFIAAANRHTSDDEIEVYADVQVSLNGREPQRLIDPTANLAKKKDSLLPADWILPLKEESP